MIKRFEVGKYYRWIGPKKRGEMWNSAGKMDAILDGRPRKCIKADGGKHKFYALFDGVDTNGGSTWSWGYPQYFEECPSEETKEESKMDIKVKEGEEVVPKKKMIRSKDGLVAAMVEAFEEVVNDAILQAKPKEYSIVIDGVPTVKVSGIQHELFPKVVKVMALGMNMFLTGPAGSGKTQMVEQAAKALNKKFYAQSVCVQTTLSQLVGYMDATGNYVRSLFREAYELGGVYLLDEIDAGNPNVLSVLNASISNGYCAFPDGMVKRHPDFIMCASGNTYGTGATRQYVGRLEIDAATLDRFVFIEVNYDEELENRICGNPSWAKVIQFIRSRVKECGLRHVVSPRASIFGASLLQTGMSKEEVLNHIVWKGMSADDKKKVINNESAFNSLLDKIVVKDPLPEIVIQEEAAPKVEEKKPSLIYITKKDGE